LKILATEIPWRPIAAIGNLMRHEYQRADIVVTWNIIHEQLPALNTALDWLPAQVKSQEPD
jgi:uncharacterized protein with HEPN domain